MSEQKFLTHEIGSLAKPPWLVKTAQGRELDPGDIEHARSWGEKVGVETLERRLQDALREHRRRNSGPVGERVRRGERDEPPCGELRDVTLVERPRELRRRASGLGGAVEGVGVQETRQRAGLEPVRRLEQRAEVVLPAQHAVRQEIEARGLLRRDERGEVALDLLLDSLLRRAAAVEVARRLDERLGARMDPGCECLQTASFSCPRVPAVRPGLFRRLLTRSPSCLSKLSG